MTILVAGATGYIGKPLYERAASLFGAQGTSTKSDGSFAPLDLACPDKFDYSIIHRDDVIYLTAAISAPDLCAIDKTRAWDVNVIGTSSFIEGVIARGGRVVFFSSDTVYGEKDMGFDETASCNPTGDYAIMKHEIERRFLGNSQFKCLRLSYVFSRDDKFTRYLTDCNDAGTMAEIFHPLYRSVIYRDDVIDIALAVAREWGRMSQDIINVGGDNISRVDFAGILRAAALTSLNYKIVKPNAEFFANRPRVIAMRSPVAATLLGRAPCPLAMAARKEFKDAGVSG